ncbi:UDP-4-amino-4,6-dideoxy-N-acetyl-beta-L-altrosamine N-acetyltransferase [Aliarcobacter butzleri]|uniref:UDP-4-amino-4, 6-dideoxy-N-acetyl-beta-L-altrosamine N-acetyltransferase n=1 Tax=Aliarcobacter butzleri TaxID=28197 RepID=UPI003B219161
MNDIKLINFVDLSLKEKKMILEWRNSPNIKKYMYTQDEISLENHLNFIEYLKNSKDKLYFLVKKDDEYIGVIYFNNIKENESLEMGIYTNPNLKGYGKISLESIINFSFNILKVKKIFAEVFFENEKAYNLYKNYNFIKIGEKSVNNKKVICMELDCRGEKLMENTEIKKVILDTVRLVNNMKRKDFILAFKCLDDEFKKFIGYTIIENEDKEKIGADKVDIYYKGELVASVAGCNYEDYYKFFDSEEEIYFLENE